MGTRVVVECVYCGAENQIAHLVNPTELRYLCTCGGMTSVMLEETEEVDG